MKIFPFLINLIASLLSHATHISNIYGFGWLDEVCCKVWKLSEMCTVGIFFSF